MRRVFVPNFGRIGSLGALVVCLVSRRVFGPHFVRIWSSRNPVLCLCLVCIPVLEGYGFRFVPFCVLCVLSLVRLCGVQFPSKVGVTVYPQFERRLRGWNKSCEKKNEAIKG